MPFFDQLNALQHSDPVHDNARDYVAARKALFEEQPVEKIPIANLTFTQHVVNSKKIAANVEEKKDKNVFVVNYGGRNYVMDGHHTIVARAKRGKSRVKAHILHIDDRVSNASEPGHAFRGNQWTGGIQSEAFQKWFAGSQVVNPNGQPLRVYHGTNDNIKKFDRNFSAQGVFWFTSDVEKLNRGEAGATGSRAIIPVYLAAKKLAGWDEYEKYSLGELRGRGFDGVKLDDDYIVFEPNQIKSATGNNGRFNHKRGDITNAKTWWIGYL